MAAHDCPLVHSHAMHQSRSRHGTYCTASLHLESSLQLDRRGFRVEECSLPIKSALSFTAVAIREISSTLALMKLLLPIEIHLAVCELQAKYRPRTASFKYRCYVVCGTAALHRRASTAVQQMVLENSIQNNLQQ